MNLKAKNQGQVFIEFCFLIPFIISLLVLTNRVLVYSWDQSHCAYLVFQSTRSALIGQNLPIVPERYQIKLTYTQDKVVGEGHCGEAFEKVEFFRLEPH